MTESAKKYFSHAIQVYRKNDYQKALELFTQAIEIDPLYLSAYEFRWHVRYLLKDYQGALEDLNKAIELDSLSASAYYNRGTYYEYQKKWLEAREDFQKALNLAVEQNVDEDLMDAAEGKVEMMTQNLQQGQK